LWHTSAESRIDTDPKTCQGAAAAEEVAWAASNLAKVERMLRALAEDWRVAVPWPGQNSLLHFHDFPRGSNLECGKNWPAELDDAAAPAIGVVIPDAAGALAFDEHASAEVRTVDTLFGAGGCNDHLEETGDAATLLDEDRPAEVDRNTHYWHHCIVDTASEAEGKRLVGSRIHHFADVGVNIGYPLVHSGCMIDCEDDVVADGCVAAASHLSFSSGGNIALLLLLEIEFDSLGFLLLMVILRSALVTAGVASEVCGEL